MSCPACRHESRTPAFAAPDIALRAAPGTFAYSRCDACGSVFQDPLPDPEQLAAAYGPAYGNYRSERGIVERIAEPLLRREAARVVQAGRSDLPVVEVGCGTGRFLERLAAAGWKGPISGVEYSADVAVSTGERTGFDVRPGTAETAELEDGRYGAIVLRHVIEHLEDPAAVVAKLARALHPEGVLYIATPDARALSARVFGARWWGYEVPRHLCVFTSSALRDLVRRSDLEVVSEHWAFAPEMWNASVFLTLDGGKGRPWARKVTSLLNPLVSGPAVVGALLEVLLKRSTMYGLLARGAAARRAG